MGGKTWNNIERIVWVKRVSDRPPFIFIAVRPDTDHSDGTGARQIERRPVNGQKALNIVNNYKIGQNDQYQFLVFFYQTALGRQ